MKKCPLCNLTYNDDDDVFCTIDGKTLVPYSDGQSPSRFSVSLEQPTEVVQRPLPPPVTPASSDNSKWLYLLIGTMALIILGMGIIFFLSRSPKETEVANVKKIQEETPKEENVSAPNQNTAKIINATPVLTPEKLPPSNTNSDFSSESNTKRGGSYLPRNFNRTYQGTVNYDEVEMRLERSGSTLSGKVIPKYRYADISVRGEVKDNGSFEMNEYSDIGVVTGVYRGRINADGTMEGRWEKPDGSKPRPFSMRVAP